MNDLDFEEAQQIKERSRESDRRLFDSGSKSGHDIMVDNGFLDFDARDQVRVIYPS